MAMSLSRIVALVLIAVALSALLSLTAPSSSIVHSVPLAVTLPVDEKATKEDAALTVELQVDEVVDARERPSPAELTGNASLRLEDIPTSTSWINQVTSKEPIDTGFFSNADSVRPSDRFRYSFRSKNSTSGTAVEGVAAALLQMNISSTRVASQGRFKHRFNVDKALALEAEDNSYETLLDAYDKMKTRALAQASRRLSIIHSLLHKMTISAESEPDRSRPALRSSWCRCVVLWLDTLVKGSLTHTCESDWMAERRDCATSELGIRELIHALHRGGDKLRTAVDADLLTMLRTVYSGTTANERLLQKHAADAVISPRPLERVPVVNSSNQRESQVANILESSGWKTPLVRDIRFSEINADLTANFGEGVCHSATGEGSSQPNRFHVNASATSWNEEHLRVLIRMDCEDVLRDVLPRQTQSDTPQVGAASCSTQLPVNHMVQFQRRTRWLYDTFIPFAVESDAFQPSAPSAEIQTDTDVDAFSIRANRVVLQKVGSYRLSQLLSPLYYEMHNVCVSPHGFGLSAFTSSGKPVIPPELRDERRNKIRLVTIRRRSTKPKWFLDKPLVLSAVQYQSDNLGHVMYRLGAQQELLRRGAINISAHIPSVNSTVPPDADDFLMGYAVIQNAAATFGVSSSLRHFYQVWNQKWFSFALLARTLTPTIEEEDDEVCFRRVLIGQEALYMYHSVGSSPPMRKRFLLSAQGSQRKVDKYFGALRTRMIACFADPSLQLYTQSSFETSGDNFGNLVAHSESRRTQKEVEATSNGAPIRIVIIQRRQRRQANLNRMLAAFVLHHSIATNNTAEPLRLEDTEFSKKPIEIFVADFERMTTSEQVTLVQTTDILMGVHGTAMQWMFMMKPGSVLIELQYPTLGCVKSNVHDVTGNPAARLFCEFGKTSVASRVTHIAFMTTELFGDKKHRWNLVIPRSTFLALGRTALCSLHAGKHHAAARCQQFYPSADVKK